MSNGIGDQVKALAREEFGREIAMDADLIDDG